MSAVSGIDVQIDRHVGLDAGLFGQLVQRVHGGGVEFVAERLAAAVPMQIDVAAGDGLPVVLIVQPHDRFLIGYGDQPLRVGHSPAPPDRRAGRLRAGLLHLPRPGGLDRLSGRDVGKGFGDDRAARQLIDAIFQHDALDGNFIIQADAEREAIGKFQRGPIVGGG